MLHKIHRISFIFILLTFKIHALIILFLMIFINWWSINDQLIAMSWYFIWTIQTITINLWPLHSTRFSITKKFILLLFYKEQLLQNLRALRAASNDFQSFPTLEKYSDKCRSKSDLRGISSSNNPPHKKISLQRCLAFLLLHPTFIFKKHYHSKTSLNSLFTSNTVRRNRRWFQRMI